MITREGFSFIELLVVLCLLGIMVGMIAPGARHWRDSAATRAARDELAAGLSWARMAAVANRGASVVLEPGSARWRILVGDGTEEAAVDLDARWGVTFDAGSTGVVTLRYDALGIGRLTNRTITFRKGSAVAGLTVSAHGRFRRW